MPFSRGIARRDGAALFDIVQGFVQSQVLFALIELDILRRLFDYGPQSPEVLARGAAVPSDRMVHLLQAGAALDLLRRRRDGRFALARRGAALLGVPGLEAMIRHHRAFYADLADPVALLRGEGETELARFWPYVFGAAGEIAPGVAERYSDLMAQSQALVAEDVLRMIPLRGVSPPDGCGRRVRRVSAGGGTTLSAPCPATLRSARGDARGKAADGEAGLSGRIDLCGGSFRKEVLPTGADAISLIRVLYDHADDTVPICCRQVP